MIATYLTENTVCNKKSNILGRDACIYRCFGRTFSFLLGIKTSEVAGFSEASGVTRQLEQHI